MASGKRASMREGPLAALFRSTEQQSEEEATKARKPASAAAPTSPQPEAPDTDEVPIPSPQERLRHAFSADIPENVMSPSTPAARERPRPESQAAPAEAPEGTGAPVLRVVGVGGAGVNAINRMIEAEVEGVEFLAINTDQQSLQGSSANINVQIGASVTRGLGSGADPELGRASAMEDYDKVKSLLKGADLNPSDPDCYLFLSKAYNSSPGQANEVSERFRRFVQLQPRNGRAHYYYAMSLWKGKRAEDPALDLHQIEVLLKTSLALDPKSAEAHLQLGNLYSDQNKYSEAIPEYEKARELDPDLADVRYRLGQAYIRTGAKDRAQEEFAVYQKIREQHLAELDKQRAEIRQFVYAAKNGATAKP